MKIIRHTARDMRQALRAVREQLGEDAVILSSRRTGEGVEVTAAVDFDASTLEAGGFSGTPAAPALTPSPSLTPPSSLNPTVLALTTPRGAKAKGTGTAATVAASAVATAAALPATAPQAMPERLPAYN